MRTGADFFGGSGENRYLRYARPVPGLQNGPKMIETELCAFSPEACRTAARAGVTRAELCASPYEGGTTPSAAAIRLARRVPNLRLSVMIRPRGGDFLYTDEEFRQMLEEVRFARECGADCVVAGLLTPDGRVDEERTARLVAEAGGMEVTFHRAFDMTRDCTEALEALVRAGCRRVLTSGGRNTAPEGLETIRTLVAAAAGRIEVMAGSGVRPANVLKIAAAGVDAVHFSARCTVESRMRFRNGAVSMGGIAGIPDDEQRRLDAALATTPRADSLRQLLASTPRGERAAMAWLIARMPYGDRDTMRLDLLRENVAYACRAREEFPWTKALPDSVFRNEVLPYAVVDEVRDGWRRDLYERFAPRVAGCRDLRAALDTVNRILPGVVGVEYNTLREKTNQSPAESMRQGMASCTGLSVLLVDALRAVGIPARFAGTAAWHDDRGNHSWTEVWIDGEWHFTEFYQPAALDRAWFLADAGQATPGDRQHAVYAVSFAPTGDWFPMVWNETSREVHATDVTQRYRDAYASFAGKAAEEGTHTTVTFRMFRDPRHAAASGDRVAANVDVFCGTEQMGGGRTAGPLQDMNDALRFLLKKNRTYTFRYANARGETTEVTAAVADAPVTVTGYME